MHSFELLLLLLKFECPLCEKRHEVDERGVCRRLLGVSQRQHQRPITNFSSLSFRSESDPKGIGSMLLEACEHR